jgi:cytochrome c oxidase cbb3-type subunit 3
LNDAIWLYGGDHASLMETVTNARAGVMPTWEGRLSDSNIKELAVYVHSLGGGQ